MLLEYLIYAATFHLIGCQTNPQLTSTLKAKKETKTCDGTKPPVLGSDEDKKAWRAGDCTSTMASGSACQPTCTEDYEISGMALCNNGVLKTPVCWVTCEKNLRLRKVGMYIWKNKYFAMKKKKRQIEEELESCKSSKKD